MNILYLINTDTYTLFYTFFILIICVTWIQYVLKKLQNKYSTFLNNEKIINHCKQILDKNNSLQENIYKLIKYNTGKDNYEDKLLSRKYASFYYLKRAIFFLHNYKFLHIKRKLNCLFIRNNITDIRNLKYLTYKKVIQFKKDMNICLSEAYNSFDYKNKKELLYIYFKLYSKIYFFFQSESIYFFHFITRVLLVSWVYTPLNTTFHWNVKGHKNKEAQI
ncbi:conserved Plasmodium protein, unknown function [Plasmodium reichenowi]|uniref:Uncharacterized protein n=8 Tax=Plasmodium (Laverania) TaxID=418107 RepID=C0H580_PLAF7|nr:conserved Plasmodium protein, unknown function [Plasmodium falciparum 3D7]XP_012762988.1 hypothetical protein PRSY57_0929500 [Plasmodium reichenowi]ETW18733.1 hypothetical protein PFFVO_02628 [Plasmodium falciparum Vietnam Oak-Knoll (FVO)]ETW36698.1 hypothetical protein PFTANZ_02656 [Plasmodium falciparum Tanzania (2000708)]EUR72578.1 hypothetical protein PFBG_02668 [Plasmodium falciparum 7G8]KAF4330737.1 hypothetical protein CYL21_1110 [Plasmodium falciparum NF54]KOB60437.1 hypothetical p|eukprot:XP_002808977.1 conserved Plasmodium protein, unknown function [Plasmodium falciparum 3D7]